MVRRMERTARGAEAAISEAISRALSRNSSIGARASQRPMATGLLALHAAARVEQVERLLLPDEGGECDGEAEAVMEAEAGEVGGETGLGGGHAEVGGEGESETPADRGALHGRHDRGLRLEQAHRLLVEMPAARAAGWGLGGGGILTGGGTAELGARTKRPALGGEDDGAHARLVVEGVVSIGEGADEGDIEEVVGRPVNLDGGDVAVEIDRDISGRV